MSREAMEAVQQHSKYQSPDDYYLFRVLLSIASFADVAGVAGVEGKHKECPSYRAIADRAHVHRNIIGDKIAELIDAGELEIAAQGGAGRGSWTVYRINLPIDHSQSDVSIHERTAHGTRESADNTLVPIVQELSHQVAEMAHELAHVRQLLSHENGTFGTRHQREHVTDTKETLDTNRETKELPPDGGDTLTKDAKPFDVYQALLGIEPGMKKGQSLRELKLLLSGDASKNIQAYTPADIVGCGAFLQTDPWRINNMVTLTTRHILEKIDKWVSAGRPVDWDEWQEKAEARASPNGTGQESRFLPKGHKIEAATGTDW